MGEMVESPPASEATAQKNTQPRMEHDGQEYDFVFSIDVADEMPPLPLPYNCDSENMNLSSSWRARATGAQADWLGCTRYR